MAHTAPPPTDTPRLQEMMDTRIGRWPLAWTLLPLRLIVGVGFVAHGAAKLSRGPEGFARALRVLGVPFPGPTAWMVTLLEVSCGAAILVGLLVALACIPLLCTMLVAMLTVHLRYGFSAANTIGLDASGPILGPPGYELSLLYIAALLALALGGPTILSVDRWRARLRFVTPSSL
jgi:putative oxidoreductase